VLVVRLTARLASRLKVKLETAPPSSSTKLGDLYANLVRVGRTQLVLAVSERTLLPVVIEAAPASSLVPRLRDGLAEVLRGLGVREEAIREEEAAMETVTFGKTANRQVVGTMVELARMLDVYVDHRPLLDVALHLAETPCRPLKPGYCFPNEVTRKLFAAPTA
jgi:hypothetical protein